VYYEVYVDVLFLENLWMNTVLLLLTAWAGRMRIRVVRIGLAAGAGSLGACLLTIASAWIAGWEYFAGTFGIACIMTGIAFGWQKGWQMRLLFLYLESFLLNGMLRYLEQFHGLNGVWCILFGSLSALFLITVWSIWRKYRKQAQICCQVLLQCGTYQTWTEALYDTGNGLYDPISGCPVSILSQELLDICILQAGKELLPRLIPYHTISQDGVLEAYRFDRMEIHREDQVQILEQPMIARMPGPWKQYQLILHRDLLSS
jgi:stage II sporulation protein GA (sporulation sigma-E factor processing peptidase)